MTTDHDDTPPDPFEGALIRYHQDLDLEPDGEAQRLAAAAEPWEPSGA